MFSQKEFLVVRERLELMERCLRVTELGLKLEEVANGKHCTRDVLDAASHAGGVATDCLKVLIDEVQEILWVTEKRKEDKTSPPPTPTLPPLWVTEKHKEDKTQ